jgi:hypothetical protein
MSSRAPAVAAYGTPSRLELPSEQLDDDAFADLLTECATQRLLGFLGSAVGAGAFAASDAQVARLETDLRAWTSHELRVEQLLLRAADALAQAGIDCRVLKGVALSRTVYPEIEQRTFGDVDLLIPGPRLADAVAVLTTAVAAERVQAELRPGFDARFGKEVLLRTDDGLELDLHRVFVDGAFGLTVITDDLFTPPYRFPLAGFELATLPMPQRFLATCYSAALGDWPPRLNSLRDVVQLVLREQPNLLDVLMMARAWRCEIVVARAVTTAWAVLEITETPPVVTWARNFEPDRRSRRLLAAHEGAGRSFTRHLAALLVLDGVRDRVAYAHAIALPSKDYLQARGLSGTRHARRALDRIRQR